MDQVGILIADDDASTQAALLEMLDSEGWRVEVATTPGKAWSALAGGPWQLVIASVAMTGVDTVLFSTLCELGQSAADKDRPVPLRVLFLLPHDADLGTQRAVERVHMPYALKPLHLHDFLDKIGDLLMETGAISVPIRRVRRDNKLPVTKPLGLMRRGPASGGRQTSMFSSRRDYIMTEEEIAEFERQEEEERKKKQKKQEKQDRVEEL